MNGNLSRHLIMGEPKTYEICSKNLLSLPNWYDVVYLNVSGRHCYILPTYWPKTAGRQPNSTKISLSWLNTCMTHRMRHAGHLIAMELWWLRLKEITGLHQGQLMSLQLTTARSKGFTPRFRLWYGLYTAWLIGLFVTNRSCEIRCLKGLWRGGYWGLN